MKKRFLSLLLLPTLLFGSFALTSCGQTDTPVEPGPDDKPGPEEPGEKIDYVTTDTNIRLRHDYKNGTDNRSFLQDGIGEVDLITVIDGDTAHFKQKGQKNSPLIKIRYYGIDTPESTGSVEPYGDKAKNFNKEKLMNAKENGTIVLTSTNLNDYVAPETDSTGERYLGMIWINETKKDAPFNELYLLNLYIVQEGYSYVKAVDKFPEFKDTFYAAEEQAKRLKLNLHSGKPDDDFNYGGYETTDLNKIKEEVAKCLEDPNHENAYENKKVAIRGTVAGYANRILYLQMPFENEETGQISYAGINIFTGMNPVSEKYTTYNTVLEVRGLCKTNENFGFQITDVYFPRINRGDENESKVIYKASECPEDFKVNEFKVAASELEARNDILFSPVNVNEPLVVTGGYDGNSGEVTLYCKTESGKQTPFNVYVPFRYTPDGDVSHAYGSYADYVGKKFNMKGIYSIHTSNGKVKYQIIARDHPDIELIK